MAAESPSSPRNCRAEVRKGLGGDRARPISAAGGASDAGRRHRRPEGPVVPGRCPFTAAATGALRDAIGGHDVRAARPVPETGFPVSRGPARPDRTAARPPGRCRSPGWGPGSHQSGPGFGCHGEPAPGGVEGLWEGTLPGPWTRLLLPGPGPGGPAAMSAPRGAEQETVGDQGHPGRRPAGLRPRARPGLGRPAGARVHPVLFAGPAGRGCRAASPSLGPGRCPASPPPRGRRKPSARPVHDAGGDPVRRGDLRRCEGGVRRGVGGGAARHPQPEDPPAHDAEHGRQVGRPPRRAELRPLGLAVRVRYLVEDLDRPRRPGRPVPVEVGHSRVVRRPVPRLAVRGGFLRPTPLGRPAAESFLNCWPRVPSGGPAAARIGGRGRTVPPTAVTPVPAVPARPGADD